MIESLLIFFWSFLVAIFSIPTIINVAHSKRILDTPNHRKVHVTEKPRLGGLAIFAGFMTAITIFGDLGNGIQQLLAGSLIIFFVGVKDDITDVSVFKKFFVQVLASGIVLFIADIRISSFQGLFGIYELDLGVSYAFSFLVILCITNAVNLIDGLDGLAGTILIIVCLSFGVYFYLLEDMPFAYIAFALAGSIVGFLRYNLIDARVFMGDTGSLVSGFVIAVLAVHFIEMNRVPSAPSIAVAILFIPIFDTLRVFAMRVFNGISPFRPDRNHAHHNLHDLGMSHLQVVVVLSVLNIIIIFCTIKWAHFGNTNLLISLGVLSIILSLALEFLTKKRRLNEE